METPVTPAATGGAQEIRDTRPRGWLLVGFVVLWLAAAAAYLASGLLGLLLLVLTPEPGADSLVFVLKAVLVVGWVGIGLWQILTLVERRWRFLAAPIVAWIWTYGLGLVLAQSAFLNWGY